MFNFAVAGALEKYQPIELKERLIAPVSPVTRIDPTENLLLNRASDEATLRIEAEQAKHGEKKATLVKGYASPSPREAPLQRHKAWKVSDLMTSSVQTLKAEDSIQKAQDLMHHTGFRHIPILSQDRKVEGLLSDRDLLRNHEGQQNFSIQPLATIMTKRVLTCFPETTLKLAAATMLKEGFSSLPVVDHQGSLLGLLTTSDILKALVHDAPLDLWA